MANCGKGRELSEFVYACKRFLHSEHEEVKDVLTGWPLGQRYLLFHVSQRTEGMERRVRSDTALSY